MSNMIQALHPLEVRVLLRYDNGSVFNSQTISDDLALNLGQANQALSWLSTKMLIEEQEQVTETRFELTELGRHYAENGTPEERLIAYLAQNGPAQMDKITDALAMTPRQIGSAYGHLARQRVAKMNSAKQIVMLSDAVPAPVAMTRLILDRAARQQALSPDELSAEQLALINTMSKKRGTASAPFRTVERVIASYVTNTAGMEACGELHTAGITGDEIGALTTKMLEDGAWRTKQFRAYNIEVPPARVLLGRPNPYGQYLSWVKDKLSSLGFEEFDGPLVETEFWNADALFMPQFHSARDIHDVYHIAEPTHAKQIEEPFLSQVAATHEDGWDTGSIGWRYRFDHHFTRRLILRSQGTVLSAKKLTHANVPGKYFGILRCFRYDQVDATHLSDFYQTEGIVLGETVNLPTLLGILKMFAEEVAGADDVRYVPGYFPFTEPSIEVHIKHPVLGWFELGGSGIFRPEVTKPLGIDVPVLAWGLGIDRMALMHLGLDDLRELFSNDLERVRLRKER